MAAQALREPAKEDATKLNCRSFIGYLKISRPVFGRLFNDTCPYISGTGAANLWPQLASFAMEYLGS
jgi:hypothetical protein